MTDEYNDVPLILTEAQRDRGAYASKLFISYKRGTDGIQRLMQELQREKYSYWFDRLDIPVGEPDWRAKIKAGIWECAGMILCLTPEASQSEPIRFEVKTALALNKPIFPIALAEITDWDKTLTDIGLPPHYNVLDFTSLDEWDSNFQKLIRAFEGQDIRVTTQERRKDRTTDEYALHQKYLAQVINRVGRLSLANINPDADDMEGAELERVYVPLPTHHTIAVEIEDYQITDWWLEQQSESIDPISAPALYPPTSRTRPAQKGWQDTAGLQVLVDSRQQGLDQRKQNTNKLEKNSENFGGNVRFGVHIKEVYLTADDITTACSRLVILGHPGSGKSTLVRHLALCLAGEARENWSRSAGLNDLPSWTHRDLTPIYVELRAFVSSEVFPDDLDTMPTSDTLWQYIQQQLLGDDLSAYAPQLEHDLREGHALLILDGLDEVPYPAGGNNLQKRQAQLKALARSLHDDYGKTRIIVASRPYAYEGWSLPHFEDITITSFDNRRRAQLAGNLFTVAGDSSEGAQAKADRLNTALQPISDSLKDRPLFITLMATIFAQGEKEGLPTRAGALYRESVLLLLERWTQARTPSETTLTNLLGGVTSADLLDRLSALAYDVHNQGEAENTSSASLIPAELMSKHMLSIQWEHPDFDARAVIAYLSEHAGILVSPGDKTGLPDFYFAHRTFQEYLAGRHIVSLCTQKFDLLKDLMLTRPQLWRIPAQLVGDVLRDTDDQRDALNSLWDLIEDLSDRQDDSPTEWLLADPQRGWLLWLCGQITVQQELYQLENLRSSKKAIKNTLIAGLRAIVETAEILEPPERAECGDALGRLGDTRAGVGIREDRLPDIAWREIPKGAFVMGSDPEKDPNAHDNETPQHTVTLPRYFAGAYPVTNAQFKAFVKAGGYTNKAYWTEAGWERKEKEEWTKHRFGDDEEFNAPNQPVVGISWYEAVAFTHWLDTVLDKPDPKLQIRLPTEREWEKLARGTNAYIYPWGDDYIEGYANIDEKSNDVGNYTLGRTSTVGLYPQGRQAEYDLYDLSGNVGEWCLSQWRNNYVDANVLMGGVWRVLRGGSWLDLRLSSCSASRDGFLPNYGYNNYGFRVVCAVPIG